MEIIILRDEFGFPPLEAMSSGTPVITSRNSSLPEIVGDSAIMVDPYDIDELGFWIRRLLEVVYYL